MATDLLISNARIVTSAGEVEGALGVADGRIDAIYDHGPLPAASEVIDAGGSHVIPGVVDVHVHFREPGQEYKATWRSESTAAAVGGVTTVLDMPNNGAKAVVNLERFLAKLAVARASSFVDFGAYAYMCSDDVAEQQLLVDAGVAGFKWDMSLAGTEVAPDIRLPLPDQALPYFKNVASVRANLGIHAEDRPFLLEQTQRVVATGRNDPLAHLAARPVEAEVIALRQAIELCRGTGVHVHVHHLSSADGLQLVRRAKNDGLRITAETIPPFLFLDEDDYGRLGTTIKIHPAVKHRADRMALWEGIRDGSIDCVATDHAPHTREEKLRGVWDANPGAIGVQTSLPLMLNAVHLGLVSLSRCVEVMSLAPARCYGLSPRKGAIEVGADADLVIVDLNRPMTIRNEKMLSPNHLTPFDGQLVYGTPLLTLLRGCVIARDGGVVGEPIGKHTPPYFG
jgi:dihydroorotase (multifunctional complex type)